ncbi:unnamed protein product [Clavelina lepadiformis]|uniref:Uncharacterized protein n=1 Tax=Clavelina lepadiformis TaxID=159417 RepID=A0ABP0GQM7_CLALP
MFLLDKQKSCIQSLHIIEASGSRFKSNSCKVEMNFLVGFLCFFIASPGLTASFKCDFEVDTCGFDSDTSYPMDWIRNTGSTGNRLTGPEQDHTTGSGYYYYMESGQADGGDLSRTVSPVLSGTGGNCSVVQFYYYMYGDDIGTLNLYLAQGPPYTFEHPLWSLSGEQGKKWIKAEINVTFHSDYKIAFEGIAARSLFYNGDIAIDDVSVDAGKCEYVPCSSAVPWCQNGGNCVDVNDMATYVCECAPGWEGEHCDSDVDECASTPCQNGGTCTHGVNQYKCICDLGYHGSNCEYIDQCISPDLSRCYNGGTCHAFENDFNCTCAPGFAGDFCQINIDECQPNPCLNGECADLVNDYNCTCDKGWVGYSCEFRTGGCDFDRGYEVCGYSITPTVDYTWIQNLGQTPTFGTGPKGDHTSGEGFYMYADATDQPNQARGLLYSPVFGDSSVGSCTTVTFWYMMSGGSMGRLNVYVSGTGNNDLETNPILTLEGDQGSAWLEETIEISSLVPYSIIFEAVARASIVYSGDIAVDDVTIQPNTCKFKSCPGLPCKNGGTCFEDAGAGFLCSCTDQWTGPTCEEDALQCLSNPCQNGGTCVEGHQSFQCTCLPLYVGKYCEYVKGSCDFEDPDDPTCSYQDDLTGNFMWRRWQGSTPSPQTGPSSDHTIGGNPGGYYLYAESTDQASGDKARIKTPTIEGSGNTCTQLSFWYYMQGATVGQLAVYLEFPGEPLGGPIWSQVSGSRQGWINVAVNISVPKDFLGVFEAVTEDQSLIDFDNRGDIAIDDVIVTPNLSGCSYQECFAQPCQNGGTCLDEQNGFKCICDDNHSGPTCEFYNQCDPNPCVNGGLCEKGGDGNFQCICESGWIGVRCAEVDFCFPDPCKNGATCTTDTQYHCECPEGYEGDTCTINPDDCAVKPCLNGGTCIDGLNSYTCQCPINLEGASCERVPVSCDFEGSVFCDWTADESSDFDWIINSGLGTNFPLSGPSVDHTTGLPAGYYIYTPLIDKRPPDGSLYRIRSPQVVIAEYGYNNFEVAIYYHMKGDGMGTFNVFVKEAGSEEYSILELIGEQGNNWKQFDTSITVATDFYVILEHRVRETTFYFGDLAVDDVKITLNESDTNEPSTSSSSTEQVSTSATTPTTTTRTVATETDSQATTTMKQTTTTVKRTTTTVKQTTTLSPTEIDKSKSTTGAGVDGPKPGGGDGVDAGTIAGAVIGAILGLLMILTVVYWFVIRPGRKQSEQRQKIMKYADHGPSGFDNPSYSL